MNKRNISVTIITVLLFLGFVSTCFADNFLIKKQDGLQGKVKAGKSLVYFIRAAGTAGAVRSWAFVDNKFVGLNKGKGYFFTYVTPGKHLFWSKMENVHAGYMKVEAGKIYYLKQKITPGFIRAGVQLVPLEEEKAKKYLAKYKRTEPTAYGWSEGKEKAGKLYKRAQEKAKPSL